MVESDGDDTLYEILGEKRGVGELRQVAPFRRTYTISSAMLRTHRAVVVHLSCLLDFEPGIPNICKRMFNPFRIFMWFRIMSIAHSEKFRRLRV